MFTARSAIRTIARPVVVAATSETLVFGDARLLAHVASGELQNKTNKYF